MIFVNSLKYCTIFIYHIPVVVHEATFVDIGVVVLLLLNAKVDLERYFVREYALPTSPTWTVSSPTVHARVATNTPRTVSSLASPRTVAIDARLRRIAAVAVECDRGVVFDTRTCRRALPRPGWSLSTASARNPPRRSRL